MFWLLSLAYADPPAIDDMEQLFGASNVEAMTGNGGLSVGLSALGEVTVLRWPSPSYYDQLNYQTSDDEDAREQPRYGALENEGLLAGLWSPSTGLTWLRDLDQTQAYAASDSPVVVQQVTGEGIALTQRAVVHPDDDVLVLTWQVQEAPDEARLVLYENLAPCLTKVERAPIRDWLDDGVNDFGAVYLEDVDALVHFLPQSPPARFDWGTEDRTASEVSAGFADEAAALGDGIYVAIGLDTASEGHQVGLDATETCGSSYEHQPEDAFDDAADGTLSGSSIAACQVTGALSTPVGAGDTLSALLAFASDLDGALAALADARAQGAAELIAEAEETTATWLARVEHPRTGDPDHTPFLDRTLIGLHQGTDRETGAIVASITTQPPYGEDWPRDSAFFNAALDLAGQHEAVTTHNLFLASVQATEDDNLTPAGAWYMNYYADGMIGGSIPFEIDEVGFSLWTLWVHAPFLEDPTERDAYLREVWPAIALGAELLAECVDEATGLQCYANEDDNTEETQTIHGASTTLLGLRSAIEASEAVCGDVDQRDRWQARADALLEAIEQHLWDADAGTFLLVEQDRPWPPPSVDAGWWIWPTRGWEHDDPRNLSHAEVIYEWARAALDGETEGGAYLNKATLGLAWAWQDRPGDLARNSRLLDQLALEVPTPTDHVGEVFVTLGDTDTFTTDNRVAVPHLWAATLTWLSLVVQHEPERLAPLHADGAELAVCETEETGRCGCSARPGGGAWVAVWALLALWRRRRGSR